MVRSELGPIVHADRFQRHDHPQYASVLHAECDNLKEEGVHD